MGGGQMGQSPALKAGGSAAGQGGLADSMHQLGR